MIFELLDQLYETVPSQRIARRVFEKIKEGEGKLCVGDIAQALNKERNEVSTAITWLLKAGFISQPVKKGQIKYYSVHPGIHTKEAALKQFLQPHES